MSPKSLTAVLAGSAAVLAVIVGVAVTIVVLDSTDSSTAAPATTTTVVTKTPSTATTAPVVETPAYVEPTVETPSGSLVAEGGECYPSEVRSFGTDASGRSLVCGYSGTDAPHWLQHADESGEIHSVGEPCDSAVDSVAKDENGLFIMCGGTTWVTHP
ncbi:MAG: hypothetical protein LBE07_09265 [Gordonia sp. (in: high G+C Gram-positive bacteria)]|jgi:hypothetical protein|nr:hypothetical protein [Gordonia sp. (in: high G+C Gram-positive bacteria)]